VAVSSCRSRFALGLFVLCVLAIDRPLGAQASSASPSVGAQSADQAIGLLQESVKALTGGSTVTDVALSGNSRRIAGSIDETGAVLLRATSVGDSRIDFSYPSGNRSEIRNHLAFPLSTSMPNGAPPEALEAQIETAQPVGAWIDSAGMTHGVPNHNLMTDSTWFFPAISVSNILTSSAYVSSYLGQVTYNGSLADHVQVWQPPDPNLPVELAGLIQHLTTMDLYLDVNTHLPVALTFNTHPDSNAAVDVLLEVRFFNYELADGAQVPFEIQQYANHALVEDITIGSVALDTGISQALFAIQ
jgi:hypothetical protein